MPRKRYRRVKHYSKPYEVEFFGSDLHWEWWGDFATKAEAVAEILSHVQRGSNPEDFRIRVDVSFTITWEA